MTDPDPRLLDEVSALVAEQWAVLGTDHDRSAIPAPDGGQVLANVRAMVQRMNALPPLSREPIKLTQPQIDVLVDRYPPDPDRMPPWLVGVELLSGVPVRLVDTVEESTPWIKGWITGAPAPSSSGGSTPEPKET